MSYTPIRCPNGCGDLPIRVMKDAGEIAVKDLDKTILTVRCRKCGQVKALTGRDLRCKLAP